MLCKLHDDEVQQFSDYILELLSPKASIIFVNSSSELVVAEEQIFDLFAILRQTEWALGQTTEEIFAYIGNVALFPSESRAKLPNIEK